MVLSEEEKKEKVREYNKIHYQRNKEKIKENYQKNKEKMNEYYEKNKDEINEKKKEWNQTEQGKKSNRISKWKSNGVICENFDKLYEYFINCKECEECDVELTVDKRTTATTRCLDHCHKTGRFRNVLCNTCNTKRRW
tara:strand:- start:403 stop:816 length:414 start_codon:yes stop_codon:yes gene_type:complete